MTSILPTQNERFGFHGTMGVHATAAWPMAFRTIRRAVMRPAVEVRAFLDAPAGRHFADEVLDGLEGGRPLSDAIEAVASRWMHMTPTHHHGQRGLREEKARLRRLVIQAGE